MINVIWLCICLSLLLASPCRAYDFYRVPVPAAEGPFYVLGSVQERWREGRVDWYYNPAQQPAAFSTDEMVSLIKKAAAKWEQMCNVRFTYLGITNNAPGFSAPTLGLVTNPDRMNVVGWGFPGLEAAYCTNAYDAAGYIVDSDIMINSFIPWNQAHKPMLEGMMAHEWGHSLGLAHSNVSTSIMFASPYNDAEYMRTLRGDDALGCAALYGVSPHANSNRVFNWAEEIYAQYLAPAVQPSIDDPISGYYYRYYPSTNSAIGTKGGIVYHYYHDTASQSSRIIEIGPLSTYTGPAFAAGY